MVTRPPSPARVSATPKSWTWVPSSGWLTGTTKTAGGKFTAGAKRVSSTSRNRRVRGLEAPVFAARLSFRGFENSAPATHPGRYLNRFIVLLRFALYCLSRLQLITHHSSLTTHLLT